MKNTKALLAALIFLTTVTASRTSLADDGVISKDQLEPGSYCHEKFPAIEGDSLASNKPVLKSQNSGDIVDYYGPCNESPTGKDQVNEQKLELEHRLDIDYQ
jgi:hypothetical protein